MARRRYAVIRHPSVRNSARRAVASETRKVYRAMRRSGASRTWSRHIALGVVHAADMAATSLLIYAPRGRA